MLYLKKLKKTRKSLQRWVFRLQTPDGLRRLGAEPPDPQVVTSIICYSYFLESVCSANVITVKKEGK